MNTLPAELIATISRQLSPIDILAFSHCNRHTFCATVEVWRDICQIKGINVTWKPSWLHWCCLALSLSSSRPTCLYLVKFVAMLERNQQLIRKQLDAFNRDLSCRDCSLSTHDLWICLDSECAQIGCGRGRDSNSHAKSHFNGTGHVLTLRLSTLELWCYECESVSTYLKTIH